MPKRGIAAMFLTVGALVLLLSFKTPEANATRANGVAVVAPSTGPNSTGPTARPTAVPGASATSAPTSKSGAATGKTVDGPVVSTQYGQIQVEVVLTNGKIQDVVALQLPTGRRSGQISSYSAPILRQEALAAQSATIDTVSGATYTSDAYAQSLQAALDAARG